MKTTTYDAHNGKSITVDVREGTEGQVIYGDGWFIIINPNSKYVSFSKQKHDVCFGDVTLNIIKEYTNQQFADEYGSRLTGLGMTVKEFMQRNCRMDIK